jgi:hypothetical protein
MTIAAKGNPSVIGAAAFPQYGSTGTTKLVPEVWSGKLLIKFYASTLFGEIANTDYQGDISSMGDKVWIRTSPDVTIRDYQKGQLLDIEAPASDAVELTIDRAKYWNFVVDDVDRFQSDMDYVDGWTQDASTQLKIVIDRDILSNIRTSAGIVGAAYGTTGAGAFVLNKNTVLDYIVDAMTALDEGNIPEDGRYVVLPPWAVAAIKKSDLKDASLAGDGTSILRNGRVGMIDRATIYSSNLLPAGVAGGLAAGENAVYFGQRHALTFASQLTKNEGPITSERTFGKLYRGLQVYGYDVLKPTALGYGVIKKA